MATADGRIFISYRRQETAWPARQLYEALCERFGVSQVFKDVDNIAPGEDFVARISATVESCQVLLAMIGPQWLAVADEDGNRRIDDPDDFVRLEVGTALSRGVLVVPILVDGARLPKAAELPPDLAPITRRQAIEINPTGFNLDRLFQALDDALSRAAEEDVAATTSEPIAEPPEPVPAAPEPVVETPAPVPNPAAPEPAIPAPEVVAVVAEPVVAVPDPVVEAPAPERVVAMPEPVVVRPEPAVEAPEPVVVRPEPAVEPPGPVVEARDEVLAIPDPLVDHPAPVSPAPEPAPVAPELAGGPATPPIPPVPPPDRPPAADQKPPRSRLPLVVAGVAVVAVIGAAAGWAVFGNPPPAPSPSPTATPSPSPTVLEPVAETIVVDQARVGTDVMCTAGRVLSITASGEVTSSKRKAGPDGAAGWFDKAAPLPSAPLGALVGTVDGDWFFVGDTLTLVCPADGELELGTNTVEGAGISGSLTAEIISRDDLTAADLAADTVVVPATASWVTSAFECTADDAFRVSATGIASAKGAAASAAGGPDGVRLRDGKVVAGQVLRTAPHRALLGRVDDGDPFLLGSSATVSCPADGLLELQVNDGVLDDNTGEFAVVLSRWPQE